MRVNWCLGLLPLLVAAASAYGDDSWRLDPRVAPTSQTIELTLDPGREGYEGRVQIDIEVRQAVASFRLNSEGPTLREWRMTGPQGEVEASLTDDGKGFLTVSVGGPLPPGDYTLEIAFTQDFNRKGEAIYRTLSGGEPYVFSHFQYIYARRAFPCWDEPAFKIPYRLRMRVPEGLIAVSNTPIESESTAEGWREIRFAETRPLPTYLLACAVGPFEAVPIEGLAVPGSVYTVRGQARLARSAVEIAPPVLDALADYFGSPYPYAKLDLLAVPEFLWGGMENAGAVTFRDQRLLLDPETAGAAEHKTLVRLLTHELAHMWFGDLVTMAWWDDLWLNEAFANFVGYKISQRLFPEYRFDLDGRRFASWAMSQDALPSTLSIRHEVNSISDILQDIDMAYVKGQAVLEMAESWLGADAFRRGIKRFLRRHAWKNARAGDLWQALSEVAEVDVETVLSSFLDQPGLPLLEGEVSSHGTLTLRQTRMLNFGFEGPDHVWIVPVSVRCSSAGEPTTRDTLLRGGGASLDLGSDVLWVTLDAGGRGYYRWRLPRARMSALADQAVQILSTPERVAFLGNVGALLDAGSITGAEYLGLLRAFGSDPEAGVLQAVLSGLARVEMAFRTNEVERPFAEYVRRTLSPAVERFGLAPTEGEEEMVSLLRPQLLRWLGDQGDDPEVQAESLRLAKIYMANPRDVDPSLGAASLQVAAIRGDRELFDAYLERFEATTVPQEKEYYLRALGSFRDPVLQRAALDLTLTDKVPTTDFFDPLFEIARTEAGAAVAMGWVRDRYEVMSSRFAEENLAYLPYVASGCSEAILEQATAFFSQPEHQVEGTAISLEKTTDETAACVSLRRREGDSVVDYLVGLASR